MLARSLAILALALAWISAPASAQDFPPLSGRVVDAANILSPQIEAELTAELEALETTTQRQLVVATIGDLQGYDIADYGYQLGREWGIGDEARNDGALLLVAPEERRVRIEVGYGLEGTLTDAVSALIIQNTIVPAFREGDYGAGVLQGARAIAQQLQLPPEEAARIAKEAAENRQSRSEKGGFPVGGLIWLAFIFFFFVLPLMRGRGRKRRYRSSGRGPWGERDSGGRGRDFSDTARDIILWEVGSAIVRGALSDGDDFGGGFGGGGFGGGFGGGGGSFGGGGASGGW